MHYCINPEEIKTEIENLGHTVTNIWNIKQYRTKQPLSILSVELKPVPNNKDIQQATLLYDCVPPAAGSVDGRQFITFSRRMLSENTNPTGMILFHHC
jgi:hypothetical protein